MDGLVRAMQRIADDGSYFVRARDVRLWSIDANGFPWKAWAKVVVAMEHHPDNRAPWVLLEDAFVSGDSGFGLRAIRLVNRWAEQREAMAAEGIDLPPVDHATGVDGDSAFANVLVRVSQSLRPPLEELVILLAPTRIESSSEVERYLEVLLTSPNLRNVRFVLAHDGRATPSRLLTALRANGMRTDARVPEDDFAKSVSGLLANSAGNERKFGQVWPRGVVPPKRVDAPPTVPDAELAAELVRNGIPPGLVIGDDGPALRRCLLEAALASKDGDFVRAVQRQRDAVVVASRIGLAKEGLVIRMGLAGYLQAANRPDLSAREYADVARIAVEAGDSMTAAQAFLGLAAIERVRGRTADAVTAYVSAADHSVVAKVDALGIEAYRLAAELAMEVRAETQAVECFNRAIRLADVASADQLKLSSAALAARTFAKILERRGMLDHAAALYARADAYERGAPQASPPNPSPRGTTDAR